MSGASWTRRSGSRHRRLCARPGCGSIAAATLRFQPTLREAWLTDLDLSTGRADGDLCARHAAALLLPRGWELHDERTVVPTEVTPTAVTPIRRPRTRQAAPRVARARALGEDAAELPGLAAPVVTMDDADAATTSEVPPTVARRVPPQLGVTEAPADDELELAEVLDARTPLLQRAFSNTRPRVR